MRQNITDCLSHIRTSSQPTALWELVVDLVRGRLIGAGTEVAFDTMDQLRGMFAVLVDAGGEPVSLPDLYARVWKSRWVSPGHHRAAIHTQICRARRLLARVGQAHRLVSTRGGYALELDERCVALRENGVEAPADADLPSAILALVRERGWATNREIRRSWPKSRTTVYRAVQRLVAAGALVAVGGGRSMRYVPGVPEELPAVEAPAA